MHVIQLKYIHVISFGIMKRSFGNHLGIIWESFEDHLGIMFREMQDGKSGGRSPRLSRGVCGAARPPNITGWINNDFHVVISLILKTQIQIYFELVSKVLNWTAEQMVEAVALNTI